MTAVSVPAPWPRAAGAAAGVWRFAKVVDGQNGDPCGDPSGTRIEWLLKRNCSISPAQLFVVYLSMCAVSLLIALGFTWHGAAPVLAFAGIELLLVGAAFLIYARHAADHEQITLAGQSLSVLHQRGTQTERAEFRAAWVRVEPLSSDRSLIELTGDGQSSRVGRYLRPDLRRPLAQELRAALRAQGTSEPHKNSEAK